jgi:chromosome segregation ATPase
VCVCVCVREMDYAGVYASSSSAAQCDQPSGGRSGAAPLTSTLGQELNRLVSGTLAAQEYRDRLEALTHAVRATDEKVLNLTRLVKLSQSIQEEKEAELRQQNGELRARVKRQEQLTLQLQRQLEEVQAVVSAQATQQVTQRVEARLAASAAQHEERWASMRRELAALEVRLQRVDATSTQHFDERLAQLEERVQRVAQTSMEATNEWAKRNFVRFKERVDSLRADVDDIRGGQQELASTIQNANCRAEAEYKKVLLLLQRKTKEADALTELVEKELQHLQKVAAQHQILASKDITPTFALDDKPYHTLKFSANDG